MRVIAFVKPSQAYAQWLCMTLAHRSQLRGGSAGIGPIHDRSAPASLLAPGRNSPEDLDPQTMRRAPTSRQDKYKDMFISLYLLKSLLLLRSSMKAIPCRPIFETRTRVCGRKLAPHAALFRMRAETEVRAAARFDTTKTRGGSRSAKGRSTTPLDSAMHLDTASDDRILPVDWDEPGTGMRTLVTGERH